MANRRAFEIAFVGLKPGVHEFNYELNNQFFIDKGAEDYTNASANVKLLLEKNTGFMLLKFEIGGKADVSCDRCGNPLKMDLWDEFKMLVKLVDNPEEMNEQEEDPDVYYISRGESHLHLADWIYEFINLSIPMQKMCGEDVKGNSLCNQEVLAKLLQVENLKNTEANPMWEALNKFKDLK